MKYQVTCGNIGTVYDGQSKSQASHTFEEYKRMSVGEYGRASGEEVALWENGELLDLLESTNTED